MKKAEDSGLQLEDLNEDMDLLHALCKWIEKSDNIKQKGFYVGYSEVDKSIISPIDFTKQDLDYSRIISGNLIRLLKKVFDEIDEEQTFAFLGFVQTLFLERSKLLNN